jgi:hypothetical protein
MTFLFVNKAPFGLGVGTDGVETGTRCNFLTQPPEGLVWIVMDLNIMRMVGGPRLQQLQLQDRLFWGAFIARKRSIFLSVK